MKQGLFAIALTASLAFAQDPPAPVRPTEQPALPASVDLREAITTLGLGPRRQGRRPTCSVFTVVSTLEIALEKATGTATARRITACACR